MMSPQLTNTCSFVPTPAPQLLVVIGMLLERTICVSELVEFVKFTVSLQNNPDHSLSVPTYLYCK